MHIHPSSPNSSISEESAATKIQANFRGYRVRKQMKDTAGDDMNGTAAASAAAAAELEAAHQQRIAGEENKSATKIQAGVRGFLVRKKQKIESNAAVKIQSSFRGFKARQEVKKLKDKWCGGGGGGSSWHRRWCCWLYSESESKIKRNFQLLYKYLYIF